MAPIFALPGVNVYSRLDPGPDFSYRGLMAWEIPAGDGRVTVDVRKSSPAGDGSPETVFAFLVRDGIVGAASPGPPDPTPDPSAAPTAGEAALGERVVLAAESGTMPVVVNGVEQVQRYPGVAPATGDAYLEAGLVFGPGSGAFRVDPAEWVVTDGSSAILPQLRAGPGSIPNGWPSFAATSEAYPVPPAVSWPASAYFIIAEVPAEGRITLEYRPAGGPAAVRWVLRGE